MRSAGLSRLHFLAVLVLSHSGLGQVPVSPVPLIVVPSASGIERSNEGSSFSEGCDRLKYEVPAPFPGRSVLRLISDELMKQGWVPTIPPDQKTGPVPGAKPTARWKSFDNAEGGRTRVRTDLWRDADGNLASYTFWYLTRDAKSLSVDARYCTAAIFGKYRCVRHPPIPHDESLYSIAMKIKRIEPTGKDVKVFVGIENNGKKPVLLGLNGELSDGSPELWVLGVEQQGENKVWSSV